MADLTDEQLTDALNGMIAGINPVIDVLSQTDVTGLRAKTFQDAPKDGSILRRVEHVAAKAVNLTALPGTENWSELSMQERAQWWVSRIGALNTIGVAFPNIFGLWARRLPITTVLGYVNQAMVLVAIAREYRVTDRARQVELIASVLNHRELKLDGLTEVPDAPPVEGKRKSLFKATWEIAQTVRGGVDEMGKRPQPARPLRWLSNVPVVGAPFNYVGERFALKRAVNEGRAWIAARPGAIGPQKPADPGITAAAFTDPGITAEATVSDKPTPTPTPGAGDTQIRAAVSTPPETAQPTPSETGHPDAAPAAKSPATKGPAKKAPAKKTAAKKAPVKTAAKKAPAKKAPAKKAPAKKVEPEAPAPGSSD